MTRKGLELDNEQELLFAGLKAHKDVRVEFLTISVPKGSGIDLEKCFQSLIIRIVGRNNKSKIQYAGVFVGAPPEHAHLFWVKPYVRWNRLNAMWFEITEGYARGIVSKTVKGDKSKRNDVRRIVEYITVGQSHHVILNGGCEPTRFFHSTRWLKAPKLTAKQAEKQSKIQHSLSDVLSYD